MLLLDRNTGFADLPPPHPVAVLNHDAWAKLVNALTLIDVKQLTPEEDALFTKAYNLADCMPSLQLWTDIESTQPHAVMLMAHLHKKLHLRTYVKNLAVVKDGTTIPDLLHKLAVIHCRQTAVPDPKVVAILAMTEHGGIGMKNTLPWGRLKGDLPRFKDMTMGNVVIQGYNTYMSIGKPLAGRHNIVITSRSGPTPDTEWPADVLVVDSVQRALEVAKKLPTDLIYVIGGAKIFEAMLPHCSRIELTVVASEDACDTFVKFENGVKEWRFQLLESVKHDNGNLSHVYYRLFR